MAELNGNAVVKYWPLIVLMGTGLVTWGITSNRISANETNDVEVKARVSQVERDLSDIKIALAKVETSNQSAASEVERLREEQARLTQALNELLRELRAPR